MVKADAYGHGATTVSKYLENIGADFFAVSNIDEAIELRNADITKPILILGYTPPEHAKTLAINKISQCVYSCDYAEALAKHAKIENVKISVHIKIDTGMGRLGFVFRHDENESWNELLKVCSYDCFVYDGIFMHFPNADDALNGAEITKKQFKDFSRIIDKLQKEGITFSIKHCANTAAALNYPEYSLDMVRIGIALYGALPSSDMHDRFDLRNTLTLKTVISNLKTVQKGDAIGYGGAFIAPKDIKVATLPIGYADGFGRCNLENGTKLSVKGKLCNIIGRVCMDQLMVDVSEAGDVAIGDEVVVFGYGSEIGLDEFANINKTIPYEILCNIGARVPRIYKK